MEENTKNSERVREKKEKQKIIFQSLTKDSIEGISLRLFRIKIELEKIKIINNSIESEKLINKLIKEVSSIDKDMLSESNVKFTDSEKEKSLRILEKFGNKK